MIKVDNFISKILHKDDNNSYSILTYFDVDEELTTDFINIYVNEIVKNNPSLKQSIIEKDGLFFFEDIKTFNIDNYYKIQYTNHKNFNKKISNILNLSFNNELKWKFLCCIDKKLKKSRIFFKIHHAYVDGYTLINLLTDSIITADKSNIVKKFKRQTSFWGTIYYYIVGTIILVITNIKIITKSLFIPLNNPLTEKNTKNKITDYIICKSLSLDKIKLATKKNNITINDFLYSLMIRADKIYRKTEKIITTSSPINVSGTKYNNNMCPLFNSINNSHDNNKLLKTVNDTFNNFKYSLFIPILSFVLNNLISYINMDLLSTFYNNFTNNTDYVYSNIIGPSIKNLSIKITDIHFLTTAKNKEIVYNIISCGDDINIICSFNKNIIRDKKHFKNCIYRAYTSLIS